MGPWAVPRAGRNHVSCPPTAYGQQQETLATVIRHAVYFLFSGDNFPSLEAIEEAVPQGKA